MTPLLTHAVVLVPFPFTDRASQKRRPAAVLSEPSFQQSSGHLLLAMVTSARQSQWPLDWPIQNRESAGLPQPCLVRFKLFTLDERLVLNVLGALTSQDREGVMERLRRLVGVFP